MWSEVAEYAFSWTYGSAVPMAFGHCHCQNPRAMAYGLWSKKPVNEKCSHTLPEVESSRKRMW